jgi:hypothetical protein
MSTNILMIPLDPRKHNKRRLHCDIYNATLTLRLHCDVYIAFRLRLHCNIYIATFTLRHLHCDIYIATFTLRRTLETFARSWCSTGRGSARPGWPLPAPTCSTRPDIDFAKTSFRPKTFQMNFHPKTFYKFPPKMNFHPKTFYKFPPKISR